MLIATTRFTYAKPQYLLVKPETVNQSGVTNKKRSFLLTANRHTPCLEALLFYQHRINLLFEPAG
jgi:hypothetical protein